jgi:hypothetical protein
MDATMQETRGPFSYRYEAYPPHAGNTSSFLWLKILDHSRSELALCFDRPDSLRALADAATKAADALQAQQQEYPAPADDMLGNEIMDAAQILLAPDDDTVPIGTCGLPLPAAITTVD